MGETPPGPFKSLKDCTLQFTLSRKEDLYWHVARNAVGNLGLDDCVVYDLDGSRGVRMQMAAIGVKNPTDETIANRLEVPMAKGVTGAVATSGQACIVDDLATDPRYIPDLEPARAEICVPLLIADEMVGVIDCEDPRPITSGRAS